MDNKKTNMYLQAEIGKNSGWNKQASPAAHASKMPAPTPMPAPMPTPSPSEEKKPLHMVLGMSYVPMQEFRELYEAEEGFARGTVFAELDYPFMGKGDCLNDRA